MVCHVQSDRFAILIERRHSQAEADNDEIHWLDLSGERCNPASLTARLITDASGPRSR